jgi:hypothetical protein
MVMLSHIESEATTPNPLPMANRAKIYQGYLDKEMTIMGVLSAFCIASAILPIKQTLADISAASTSGRSVGPYFIVGLCGLLVAALGFYRQRSLLAWFYGQIALCICRKELKDGELDEWLDEADSWATWVFYRWGFAFLVIGIAAHILALLAMNGIIDGSSHLGWDFFAGAVGILLGFLIRLTCLLREHRYDDNPISSISHFFGAAPWEPEVTGILRWISGEEEEAVADDDASNGLG